MQLGSRLATVAIALLLLLAPATGDAVVVQRLAGVRGPFFGAARPLVTIELDCNQRQRICPDLDTALQELLAVLGSVRGDPNTERDRKVPDQTENDTG